MAKAKKAGKPKRNKRNLAKNIKRIQHNDKVLKAMKEALK